MNQITIIGQIFKADENGLLLKRRGKGVLGNHPDKDGYLKYAILIGGKTINLFVHRVVWEVFYGIIPAGMTIDHIDGNKRNNKIDNLQLMTPEANVIKGNAKNWKVVSPEGEIFEIYNMESFCKDHRLHAGHMREVANLKRNQHKGWTYHG